MIPGCRREARLEEAPGWRKTAIGISSTGLRWQSWSAQCQSWTNDPAWKKTLKTTEFHSVLVIMKILQEVYDADLHTSSSSQRQQQHSPHLTSYPHAEAALSPRLLMPTWSPGIGKEFTNIYIYIHFLARWNEGKCSQMYGCLTLIATQSVVHQ